MLAKLGVKTGFVGAIGNDREGRILVRNLKSAGDVFAYVFPSGYIGRRNL